MLAGWVLVLTTLSPAVRSAQTIMALYRCRWQVEIAIKRWKSVLDVDALRAKATSPLAEVWLHGKLLYALMLERRMRRQLGDSWGRLDHERLGTWWRVWGMLKDERAPMITGALFWKEDAWAACLKVLAERPRRRKLQQLPPEAIDLLYRCDASKQEGDADCRITLCYQGEPMLILAHMPRRPSPFYGSSAYVAQVVLQGQWPRPMRGAHGPSVARCGRRKAGSAIRPLPHTGRGRPGRQLLGCMHRNKWLYFSYPPTH